MASLHDMHCHLDFMANGELVAAEAAASGTMLFANTVTPAGFEGALERFGTSENVRIGLGFHPWWVSADNLNCNLDTFEQHLIETRFVGEIGLDFGRRGEENREEQLRAFRRIAALCAAAGGKLISLHAIRSAETALDILEESGAIESCTCIFHWFSDSSTQLARARRAGCYFSVNPMMAAAKRGREYLRAIAPDHLLLETDAPPEEGMRYSYEELRAQLAAAADAIAASHGPDVLDTVAATAERLLT